MLCCENILIYFNILKKPSKEISKSHTFHDKDWFLCHSINSTSISTLHMSVSILSDVTPSHYTKNRHANVTKTVVPAFWSFWMWCHFVFKVLLFLGVLFFIFLFFFSSWVPSPIMWRCLMIFEPALLKNAVINHPRFSRLQTIWLVFRLRYYYVLLNPKINHMPECGRNLR